MTKSKSSYRNTFSFLIQMSRALLILCLIFLCVFLLTLSPAILGYHPFIVEDTDADHTVCPVGALAYFRYEPIESVVSIPDGTPVAVRNDTEFSIHTIGQGEDPPLEWIEGRVSAFYIPHFGKIFALLSSTNVIIFTGVFLVLLLFLAFLLPRWCYKPKYGKKKGASS